MRFFMIFASLAFCFSCFSASGSSPAEPITQERNVHPAGASCPDLDAMLAKDVAVEVITGPVPELAGGAIVPGRYELTSARDYIVVGNPEADAPVHRAFIDVTTTHITSASGAVRGTTLTMQYAAAGNVLDGIVQCWVGPDDETFVRLGAPSTSNYEATPTTITLASPRVRSTTVAADGGSGTVTEEAVRVWTFTRSGS
jgi:hypothetical protein